MIELEKLYDSVEQNLTKSPMNWRSFASGFKSIFKADVVLYRSKHAAENEPATDMEIIATSDPDTMDEYIEKRIFEMHPVSETNLAPLEPTRRTDLMADEDFRRLGALSDYLISHNMFFMMVVPSIMPDGSFVSLYVWRGESDGDFSDIEKQRLTLIMRHLLAIVGGRELTPSQPSDDLLTFGARYSLTPTEIEILGNLLQGHSLKSIASETDRSYGTVRWHVQNILEKCHVKTQRNLLSEFYRLIRE